MLVDVAWVFSQGRGLSDQIEVRCSRPRVRLSPHAEPQDQWTVWWWPADDRAPASTSGADLSAVLARAADIAPGRLRDRLLAIAKAPPAPPWRAEAVPVLTAPDAHPFAVVR